MSIKQMPRDKAPRLDGFTWSFYKESWEIIKLEVMAIFMKFYNLNRMHFAKINTTNIILLPKKRSSPLTWRNPDRSICRIALLN